MRPVFFHELILCTMSDSDIPDKSELSLCKVWVQYKPKLIMC